MPVPNIIETVLRVNTRQANTDLARFRSRLNSISQPLGRISGDASEFAKSLEAAAARVTAFGAIAGVLAGVGRSIAGAAKATVAVNKELTELSTYITASERSLNNFGKSIFNIARQTASDFETVASAVKEFARQGLSAEETLKRTRSALILSRIAGMDYLDAVNSLTAAINTFNKSALDSEQIVNKLIAVDTKFAVSSGQIAQAISRVGSSAQEAGLDLNQLIATVTAVQQITGRGGAVIGNSLKTIFTRIQRPEVLEQLQQIGVIIRDQNGALLDAQALLKNFAQATKNLSQVEAQRTKELLGGVFQINQLQAITRDLTSSNSLYERALRVSNSATDEAVRKNEQLNKSYSALFRETLNNARQTGQQLGENLFGPLFKSGTGTLNTILKNIAPEGLSEDGEKMGEKLGVGITNGIADTISKGLGNVLNTAAGPAIAALGAGLLLKLGSFGGKAFGTLTKSLLSPVIDRLGPGKKVLENERLITAAVQNNARIQAMLSQGVYKEYQMKKLVKQEILAQNLALKNQQRLVNALMRSGVPGLGIGGITMGAVGGRRRPRKNEGYIPAFAREEMEARAQGAVNPKAMMINATIQGKTQPVIVNDQETVFNIGGETAIIPNYKSINEIPSFNKGRKRSGIFGGRGPDLMMHGPYDALAANKILPGVMGGPGMPLVNPELAYASVGKGHASFFENVMREFKAKSPKGRAFFSPGVSLQGIRNFSSVGGTSSLSSNPYFYHNLALSGELDNKLSARILALTQGLGEDSNIKHDLGYVGRLRKVVERQLLKRYGKDREGRKEIKKLLSTHAEEFIDPRLLDASKKFTRKEFAGTIPNRYSHVVSEINEVGGRYATDNTGLPLYPFGIFGKNPRELKEPVNFREIMMGQIKGKKARDSAEYQNSVQYRPIGIRFDSSNPEDPITKALQFGNKGRVPFGALRNLLTGNKKISPRTSLSYLGDKHKKGSAKEVPLFRGVYKPFDHKDKLNQVLSTKFNPNTWQQSPEVESVMFSPRSGGSKFRMMREFLNRNEPLRVFLERNVEKHIRTGTNTESVFDKFVSTSSDPQVAMGFGDFVASKNFRKSRIVNKKSYDKLVDTLGSELEAKKALLRASTLGGGKGIGFDIMSFSKLPLAKREKEVAFLNKGRIPSFNAGRMGNLLKFLFKGPNPKGGRGAAAAQEALGSEIAGSGSGIFNTLLFGSAFLSDDPITAILLSTIMGGQGIRGSNRAGQAAKSSLMRPLGRPLTAGQKGANFIKSAGSRLLPLGLAAAGIGSVANTFFSNREAKEIEKLELELNKLTQGFEKSTGKLQDLSETLTKYDNALADSSTLPSTLIDLNKTIDNLILNVAKGDVGLAERLRNERDPVKRRELVEQTQREQSRALSLGQSRIDFLGISDKTGDDFLRFFREQFSEVSVESRGKIDRAGLPSLSNQDFLNLLENDLNLTELSDFFQNQEKATRDRLIPAFKDFVAIQLEIADSQKEAVNNIGEATKDFRKRIRDIRNNLEVSKAARESYLSGLSGPVKSFISSAQGNVAGLAFERDLNIANRRSASNTTLLQTVNASDLNDQSIIKGIAERGVSEETLSFIAEKTIGADKELAEKLGKLSTLITTLIGDNEKTRRIEENNFNTLKDFNDQVRAIQQGAGGIQSSLNVSEGIASSNKLVQPLIQARLGALFGSRRDIVSGQAQFLKEADVQLPGMGILETPQARNVERGLAGVRGGDVFRRLQFINQLGNLNLSGQEMFSTSMRMGRDQAQFFMRPEESADFAKRVLSESEAKRRGGTEEKIQSEQEIKSLEDRSAKAIEPIVEANAKLITGLEEKLNNIFKNISSVDISASSGSIINVNQAASTSGVNWTTVPSMPVNFPANSGGFIPSFANPLRDAISRESQYVPTSTIRVNQSNKLKNSGNPMGLAVTNTIDEPNGLASLGLASKGFIPNFAAMGEVVRQKGLSALAQGKLLAWDNMDDLYYKVNPDFSIDYDQSFKERPRGYKVINTALADRSAKYSILNLRNPFPQNPNNKLVEIGASGKAKSFDITGLLKKGATPESLLNEINKMSGGDRVLAKLATGESNLQGKGIFGKSAPLNLDDARDIISNFKSTGDKVMIEKFAKSIGTEFRVHVGIDADGVPRLFKGGTVDKNSASVKSNLNIYEKAGWAKDDATKFINLSKKAAENAALKQAAELASKGVRDSIFGFDISSTSYKNAARAGIKNLDTFDFDGRKYVSHIYEFNPTELAGASGYASKQHGTLEAMVRSVLEPDMPRVSSEPPPLPNQRGGMSLNNLMKKGRGLFNNFKGGAKKSIDSLMGKGMKLATGAKSALGKAIDEIDKIQGGDKLRKGLMKIGALSSAGLGFGLTGYSAYKGDYPQVGLDLAFGGSGLLMKKNPLLGGKFMGGTMIAQELLNISRAENFQTAKKYSDIFDLYSLFDLFAFAGGPQVGLGYITGKSMYRLGNVLHQNRENSAMRSGRVSDSDILAQLMLPFMQPEDAIPAGGFPSPARGTMASIEEELKRPRRQSLPPGRIGGLLDRAKSLPVTPLGQINTDILPEEYSSLPNWMKERIRSRVKSLARPDASADALRDYLSRYAKAYNPVGNYNRLRKMYSEEQLRNYVPNFASGFRSEMSAIASSPAYAGFRNAVPQMSSYYPNVIKNSAEIEVPATDVYNRMGFVGASPKNPSQKYAILNPAQQQALGYASNGYVPNFAMDQFAEVISSALEKAFTSVADQMGSSVNTSNVINVSDQRSFQTNSEKINGIMEFLSKQFPREMGKFGPNMT